MERHVFVDVCIIEHGRTVVKVQAAAAQLKGLILIMLCVLGSNSPGLQHLSREGGPGPAALPAVARS